MNDFPGRSALVPVERHLHRPPGPALLTAATSPDGARALATALNPPILLQMKADVTQSLKQLHQKLSNSGAWLSWDFFNPEEIYGG